MECKMCVINGVINTFQREIKKNTDYCLNCKVKIAFILKTMKYDNMKTL